MKKKVWIGIGITTLIVVMVGVSVFRTVFAETPSVLVTEAKKEEISSFLMIPGSLELQNTQEVYESPEFGEIDEILVEEGQKVKKGEVIAKLKNQQLELEVEQNEISIESGYLRINQVLKQIDHLDERKKDLRKQIGKKEADKQLEPEYDQLEAEKRMANLELRQTLLQKDLLEERVKDLEITSLLDGTVISVNETPPNPAQAATPEPRILIGTLNKTVASGQLSQYDALKVKEGQKVILESDAVPDEQWQGEVSKVGTLPIEHGVGMQGDSQAVQYPIIISLTSDKMDLKPGFQLVMEIETERKETLVIPAEAVKYEGDKTFVYIVEDNIARQSEIKIGITSGESLEILDGAKEGDQIIVNPSEHIADGTEVTIK